MGKILTNYPPKANKVPVKKAGGRWKSIDEFVAVCNVINAINDAKIEMGESPINISIVDINTLQDLLISQGYAIRKIR
jgi:hypothetical protein